MKTVSLATGTTPPTQVEPVVQLPLAAEYFFAAKDVVVIASSTDKIIRGFKPAFLDFRRDIGLGSLGIKKCVIDDVVISSKNQCFGHF